MTTSRGAGAFVARVQHRVAGALHVDEAARSSTVVAMLETNARRVPGYWIQLVLAAGIATLGLVLNSTAVVIGAMLVSPLMGPLIELGMGFAVGSSLLVMRASVRVVVSVAIVVGAAALMTIALPFHEITAEVSARAAPTVLDLLVAMFCALTAAYTTVRPGSDTTAAAAGTAVGIALVPPLCVIGFGVGVASSTVAGGATLLFTANLSAILVLSALSFLLLGFNQVDAAGLERTFLQQSEMRADETTLRMHRWLGQMFGSRYGGAMRMAIPVLFLAAVLVPLKRALDEVTWEVRARDAVRRVVHEASPQAVQTQMTVERRTLSLRLLIVGTTARAVSLEDTLVARLRRAIGVTPSVTVVAVPNARALMSETAALAHTPAPAAPASTPVEDVRARTGAVLADAWPAIAGPLLGWDLMLFVRDTGRLTVRHLGTPPGAVAEALLARTVADRLRAPLSLRLVSLPSIPVEATAPDDRAWLASAMGVLDQVARTEHAVACVRAPIAAGRRPSAAQRAAIAALRAAPTAVAARVTIDDGPRLSILVAERSCAPAAAAVAPAVNEHGTPRGPAR